MSNTYTIADLHIGHNNILNFSKEYRSWATTSDEHDHALIARIAETCSSKRDLLFLLGDVCFDIDKMEMLNIIPARKILIRGNHDQFQLGVYSKYFEDVRGIQSYKGFWLSHAPIHPHELRGRKNIHGHVHQNSIRYDVSKSFSPINTNYINACVENCDGIPINMQAIRDDTFKGRIS